MTRIAVWLGWLPVALILTPVWLDGTHHEGFRPERGDLDTAAGTVVVLAGLVLGGLHGARTAPGTGGAATGRRLAAVLAATAGAAGLYLAADDLMYRYVVPIDEGPGGLRLPPVLLAVAAAAVGFGAGLLLRLGRGHPGEDTAEQHPGDDAGRHPGPPRAGWYAVAAAAAVAGTSLVTGFVGVGAELATTRFVPGAALTATSLDLPAGRHAVFAAYGTRPEPCRITDATGTRLPVRAPSVRFTDNSDSIVTVLSGVFEVPAAGRVVIDCPDAMIGPPPQVRGPLGRLLFAPVALLWLAGALPGALLAARVFRLRRGGARRAAGTPGR